MSSTYDNARHQVRQLLSVGDALGFDFNVTGTNASDVESYRFRVPRKITVVFSCQRLPLLGPT